jgi:four helix bundle protein
VTNVNTSKTSFVLYQPIPWLFDGTFAAVRSRVAPFETYRDLEAWQFGMKLVEQVYAATKTFPADERFGLTSQIRRAAVSIPSNIAEGPCRKGSATYAHHVNIAVGSHAEVETRIEIALRLGYLRPAVRDSLMATCDSTGPLMNGLLNSLERRLERQRNVPPA